MKYIILIISSVLLLCATPLYAQLDSIQKLEEVILNDVKLNEYAEGYKLIKISDTIIERDSKSLTDALRFNSTIYFKENGYGMVSSPSFRGTNAQQTAVIWNGISINSNLTGQTDFNTISPSSFTDITIRNGGGGTQYGSGAVGGSIHLNNEISFKKKESNDLRLLYGSFSTLEGSFKTTQSKENMYFDLGIDFVSSENDYEYLGTDKKNENGEFSRFNVAANTGYKFKKSTLTWNSNYFYSDRNFSGSITAPAKDNYKDVSTRNLVSWNAKTGKFTSIVKGAHLFERYQYFPDKNKTLFFEGKSNTILGDYQLDYLLNNKIKVSTVLNYTYIKAEGDNIGTNDRNTIAAVLLLKHQINEKWSYGVNLRQEFLNDFENPFLFAVDGKYNASSWYILKGNASKNYRVPTFNDLYWVAGGNEDLNPETSYQAELGNEFHWNNFQILFNGFYIHSKDLIKWQPGEDGQFSPVNISETENYGLEFTGIYSKNFKKHQVDISGNYAYTSAIDKEKDKQLIYVPFHKITGLLNYSIKQFSAYYQILYNGEVFTTTDNSNTLESYSVSNLGLNYKIKNKLSPIKLGIKINNIFDIYYENVAYRPMPNRNYQLFLNFKF